LLVAVCGLDGLLEDWQHNHWLRKLDWALLLQDHWLSHWSLNGAVAGLLLNWALLLQDHWLADWGLDGAVAWLLFDDGTGLLEDWALLCLDDWCWYRCAVGVYG